MGDLDVSVRLRLDEDLSKKGDKVERALKDIKKAAEQLGRSSSGRLSQDMARLADAGRRAKADLEKARGAAVKLNTVKTDRSEREVRQLGKAADRARADLDQARSAGRKLDRLRTDRSERELRQLGRRAEHLRRDFNRANAAKKRLAAPTRALGSAMTLLGDSAKGAFTALTAFLAVDRIVDNLNRMKEAAEDLDRELASVAVTAEMRDPKVIEELKKRDETFQRRYGLVPKDVGAARQSFAAAGFPVAEQDAVLDPTLKAAKAGDSTGTVMSRAVIALLQNLNVSVKDIPAALDMMSKGAKLGSFEVDAMAQDFPSLGALYRGSGREGLDAVAELVALAQIVRMGAGNQSEAATNLQRILSSIFAPDAVKNFEEKGVDLAKLAERAKQNDQPYILAIVDEIMRLTGGDEFQIGELFGNMQAKSALRPLIENREKYDEFLQQIRNESAGTVEQDWKFLRDRPKEERERRGAVWGQVGREAGAFWGSVVDPIAEQLTRLVSPEYRRQEVRADYDRKLRETDLAAKRAEIADLEADLAARPKPKYDFGIPDLVADQIRAEIQRKRQELKAAEEAQRPADQGGPKTIDDLQPTTMSREPRPRVKPPKITGQLKGELGTDLSAAATEAMDGYNTKLAVEGQKAVAIAQRIAGEIRAILSFNASPTVSPRFGGAGGGAPAPASAGRAAGGTGGAQQVSFNQHFHSRGDSKSVARRVQRAQNRAIRVSRAGALHDTGRLS